MQHECAADTEPKPSRSKPKRRLRRARKPLDGRTRLAKRIRELAAGYVAALGHSIASDLRDACERAAQLTAISEDARRKALSGGIGLDDLVRVEGVAARARAEMFATIAKRKPEGPTLAEYVASKAAAGAAP